MMNALQTCPQALTHKHIEYLNVCYDQNYFHRDTSMTVITQIC
jgi:hypothetical protein